MKFLPGKLRKRAKTLRLQAWWLWDFREHWLMKVFAGYFAAGLTLFAAGAQAQMPAPYEVRGPAYVPVSDFGGPYAAVLPEASYGPRYSYGPTLLPRTEVYTVLRDAGFSPLGIPHRRGFVYSIAVIDPRGDDGRLIIDARDGRIIRFIPAYRTGENFDDGPAVIYGRRGPLPPITHVRAAPRPPRSVPHVASRTAVPVPKASPLAAKRSEARQQLSAATQPKPAEVPAAPPAITTGSIPAKPAVQIAPTQDMPKVQGFE